MSVPGAKTSSIFDAMLTACAEPALLATARASLTNCVPSKAGAVKDARVESRLTAS